LVELDFLLWIAALSSTALLPLAMCQLNGKAPYQV